MREQIAALEKENANLQASVRHSSARDARSRRSLAIISQEIERIATKHSALLPIKDEPVRSIPAEYIHHTIDRPRALWDVTEATKDEPITIERQVLHKLSVEVVRKEAARMLHVRVSVPGARTKEFSTFISDEAIHCAMSHEAIIHEVAMKLYDALPNL